MLQTVKANALKHVRTVHAHNGPNGLTPKHVKLMEPVFDFESASKMENRAANALVTTLRKFPANQKNALMSNVIVTSTAQPMAKKKASVQVIFLSKNATVLIDFSSW